MSHALRPYPATERTIERLIASALDAVEAPLGFRPEVHLDWPAGNRVSRVVLDAIGGAIDASLARVAHHRGPTSAFVSVSWRSESVEVCVVDDGSVIDGPTPSPCGLVAASGVEHDVDDFGDVGICQWWSIPHDLLG